MVNCSIKWCGNASDKQNYLKHGITFHRFPKCPKTRAKWIKASRRDDWLPSNNSVICSRHFTEDCFNKAKGRRLIFSSSVPTLMLPILESPQTKAEVKLPEAQALETNDPSKLGEPNNHAIIHLKSVIKRKDVLIKRLQSQNRYMTKAIKKLKSLLEESKAEKKISVPETVKLKVKKSASHFVYIKPGEEDEYE